MRFVAGLALFLVSCVTDQSDLVSTSYAVEVADLGASKWDLREKASADFMAMGAEAYPILIEGLKDETDAEIIRRAHYILLEGANSNTDLEAPAEAALEEIAARTDKASEEARYWLDRRWLEFVGPRALHHLTELGASARFEPDANGVSVLFMHLTRSSWRGSSADFRWFEDLRAPMEVSIHHVPIGPTEVASLSKIQGQASLQIVGGALTVEGLAALSQTQRVDYHAGGMLGLMLATDSDGRGAPIDYVSRTAKLTLNEVSPGARLVSVNGQPVKDAASLLAIERALPTGERVTMTYRYADKEHTLDVELVPFTDLVLEWRGEQTAHSPHHRMGLRGRENIIPFDTDMGPLLGDWP
jgi:hypothetical protein